MLNSPSLSPSAAAGLSSLHILSLNGCCLQTYLCFHTWLKRLPTVTAALTALLQPDPPLSFLCSDLAKDACFVASPPTFLSLSPPRLARWLLLLPLSCGPLWDCVVYPPPSAPLSLGGQSHLRGEGSHGASDSIPTAKGHSARAMRGPPQTGPHHVHPTLNSRPSSQRPASPLSPHLSHHPTIGHRLKNTHNTGNSAHPFPSHQPPRIRTLMRALASRKYISETDFIL